MAEHKVDIFESFRKLNNLELDFWDKLTPEEQKQVSPYVFLMWMQNSPNDSQVLYLNEFVNQHMFGVLGDKPDVAFTLLSLSSRGKQQRYPWIKRLSRKDKGAKAENVKEILSEYFDESERNIGYYLDNITVEEFLSICSEMGYQDDEQKRLKKEFEKARA